MALSGNLLGWRAYDQPISGPFEVPMKRNTGVCALFLASAAICSLPVQSHAQSFRNFLGDFARSEAERRDRESMNLESGRWDTAELLKQNRTGDYSISQCVYKTLNGFEFATNVRNRSCPFRAYINPETMQVAFPSR